MGAFTAKLLVKIFILYEVFCLGLSMAQPQSCLTRLRNIEITCHAVQNSDFKRVGPRQTCWGDKKITISFPGASVSSIIHSDGSPVENIQEIEALRIRGATVQFIPAGIKTILPNLAVLMIESSGLLTIDKNDLKEFGSSLEYLALGANLITSIDGDLFEHNPSLITLSLHGNPIRHIEPEFFSNLKLMKNAQWLNLQQMACMNQLFDNENGLDIVSFEWNNGGCFNETAKIETKMAPIDARMKLIVNTFLCMNRQKEIQDTYLSE